MATTTDRDVIDEVIDDHAQIKRLFAEVESATGTGKRDAFEALMRKLVVHETAEQEVVHPLTRAAHAEGVVDERLSEEKEGERMLAELAEIGPDDAGFDATFTKLKEDVLQHARMEEQHEHPKIRAEIEESRLRQLATAFRAAETAAPTRPHPHGPTSATGNMAVGPIVAIMDRARDAIRDAMRKISA
jgi:hemerythrin superfamily protein